MMLKRAAAAALLALALPAATLAQTPQALGPATTRVPAQPSAVVLADGTVVGPANPLPTRDGYEAPVASFVPISGPGVTVTPGRGIAAVCTGSGSATLQAADGSAISVPLNVGFNQFGFAVVQVQVGPTASCTYTNLK